MNTTMKWPTKFLSSNFFKIFSIFLALGLIVALSIESGKNQILAQTNPPSPQKWVTDSSGVAKSTFATGENGYLTLRNYADRYASSTDKADVVLLIDNSNSMNKGVDSSWLNKCTQSQSAAKNFVRQIDITKNMAVGVITYSTNTQVRRNLLLVDSAADKTTVINAINWSCSGATDMTKALNATNTMFQNNGRAGAQRYSIFFTDGGENTSNVVPKVVPIAEASANDQWFQRTKAENRAYLPALNSALLRTKNTFSVKYFTIYYGNGGNTAQNNKKCTYDHYDDTLDGGNPNNVFGSWGCPLMRYVAGYTNDLWNTTLAPADFIWDSDYEAGGNNVDENYFYKAGSEVQLFDIYSRILNTIEARNAQITVWEKLPSGVQFSEVASVVDKGGRSYPVNIESMGDNLYKITLPEIPTRYQCETTDTTCLAAATNGEISGNFVDVKVKLLFQTTGIFDLDSNYSGCDAGDPVFTTANSKVDYTNPQTGEIQTVSMPALCLNVIDGGGGGDNGNESSSGLIISKMTYKVDPQTGEQTQQGSFEAGDEVAVKLTVKETLPYRQTWKIKDTIPSSVGEIKGQATLQTPGSGSIEIAQNLDGDILTLQNVVENLQTSLIGGTNVIEYHYKI